MKLAGALAQFGPLVYLVDGRGTERVIPRDSPSIQSLSVESASARQVREFVGNGEQRFAVLDASHLAASAPGEILQMMKENPSMFFIIVLNSGRQWMGGNSIENAASVVISARWHIAYTTRSLYGRLGSQSIA